MNEELHHELRIRRWARALSLLGMLIVAGCDGDSTRTKTTFVGRELVLTGHYEQALSALAADLADDPRGPHASRAHLFAGKAALGLGRMDDAKAAFERCIREFPDSLEAHKSRYKLALLALLTDDRDGALSSFRALAETPDGPLAPEAAAMVRYLEDE